MITSIKDSESVNTDNLLDIYSERLEELNTSISEASQSLNDLQKLLDAEKEKTNSIKKRLKIKEEEIKKVRSVLKIENKKMKRLKQKHKSLETSRSWRYTKPIRDCLNIVRKKLG